MRTGTILQDRYKGNIFFAEISGRKNVVCFRDMTSWIIRDQWYNNKRSNADDEAKQITEIAAKLIKNDIRDDLKRSTDIFPSTDDASKAGWIPDTLRHFLKQVIKSEVNVESIGRCILKGALPRSFTLPILFALAEELDHILGSRWLKKQLFKLAFLESYSKVICFKQTVGMTEEIGTILQSRAAEDNFTSLVGDNVDHNATTLDGLGTFHGMDVREVITNKNDTCQEEPLRNRPKKYVKVGMYLYMYTLRELILEGNNFRKSTKF